MNYRNVTKFIAGIYLVESIIVQIALGICVARIAYFLIFETKSENLWIETIIMCLVTVPVSYFCYYCTNTDWKLLKSTELDRTPAAAIELSKASLRLTKVGFYCRFTFLIMMCLTQFCFLFYHEPTLRNHLLLYVLTLTAFQLPLLVLFPGTSGFMVYMGDCWPYTFKFSFCREATTMFILINVLLRGTALYIIIQYNNEQIEMAQEVAAYPECTDGIVAATVMSHRSHSCVRYNPADARINMFSNIFTHASAIHNHFSQMENVHVRDPSKDLPSYEEVTSGDPPSYAEVIGIVPTISH